MHCSTDRHFEKKPRPTRSSLPIKNVLTSPQFETKHPVYFGIIFCKYQKDLRALLKTDARRRTPQLPTDFVFFLFRNLEDKICTKIYKLGQGYSQPKI